MRKTLEITDSMWSYGSYPRKDYKKDMLYTFYQYKDFQAVYNMGRFDIQDILVDQMYQDGLVALELKKEYERQVYRFIEQMERYDSWPVEKIYGKIHQLRKQFISARGLEKEQQLQMERGCSFTPEDGIDQTRKKQELMENSRAVIFALCEPKLFCLMKEDIRQAFACQAEVYVLVSKSRGNGLPSKELMEACLAEYEIPCDSAEEEYPHRQGHVSGFGRKRINFLTDEDYNLGLNLSSIAWNESLQRHIDDEEAALMVYGEEGFLHCRRLRVESIVHAVPYSYFTRAMTNQLDGGKPSVVYVPSRFDITHWVKLTEKTLISYWQFARLWEDYGNSIYDMTVEELYLVYPQYFINIYETGKRCQEAEESYPVRLRWPSGGKWKEATVFSEYYRLKDKVVSSHLNRREGLTYISTYFDENLAQVSIPWCSPCQQTGILVQGIRTKKAEKSRVISCQGSLRQQLKQKNDALLIFSNFLFFLTPKLGKLYNELRSDRPLEQTDGRLEHLDYMLCEKGGQRVETFPLYHKACIAMKEDGNFLFFRYRLGGGSMTVGSFPIRWTSRDVDVKDVDVKGDAASPVLVYTPYYSQHDLTQESGNYRVLVGAGRVNLVMIQNRIVCVRDGDVVLPSIGVVVSLDRETGQDFLNCVALEALGDGYYDCGKLHLSIHLDGPEQIPGACWNRVRWAFGGGMSLILEGKSMFEDHGDSWSLEEEGWLSPLSRQTQETEVHKMARHPRTAVGTTKNGDFFVLVFSGRTLLSAGADYRQMCLIAKKLFPDVWCMMNVDGGGSSVLGTSIGGSFMELSYPATSMGSCAGMVRPINTVLCLEQ